ncbi:hypothetical protein [Anaerocolumna aminovalerica]|uniref:hypothetical protein n=1 Tax=Anaerocolumna aminovalerica TaxID=1527 RepID=UPI001C0EBA5D|nr:hypothetical protein [Anaerocolumna aminovalerica]MBU5331148.1 hypothetical protein [Anaerocolumna aminovalerica]
MNKKRIMQKVISSTFAFLLTMIFVCLFALIGLYYGVFNNRIILSKVNESNHYNEVYEELLERTQDILKESGLPLSVMSEAITLERVYIGGKYYIEDTLLGKEPMIQSDKVRTQLEQNINEYLMEEGISRTKELDAGIIEVVDKVEQEYKRGIHFQFVNYIAEYKVSFMRLFRIEIPILVLLVGTISVLLIKLHRYKHLGIRYIAYAVIASSCIVISSSAFLLITKSYERMGQQPDYYNRFLTNYLRWDIQVFMYLGGIGMLLAVLLIILVSYLKNNITSR